LLAFILLAPPLQPAAASARKKSTPSAKPAPSKKTAAPKSNKSPGKKSSQRTAAKSGASKKTTVAKSSSRRRAARRTAARNQVQRAPDPERIKQIQAALAARGYEVEPTGVWDNRSVAAVKKFQDDNQINNLTGKGKLDPLTLITLGLGPERGPQADKQKTNPEGKQP